jgi:hypothetical protein
MGCKKGGLQERLTSFRDASLVKFAARTCERHAFSFSPSAAALVDPTPVLATTRMLENSWLSS